MEIIVAVTLKDKMGDNFRVHNYFDYNYYIGFTK